MKLENLNDGMTVFSVSRGRHPVSYTVFVKKIDLEKRRVLASYNGRMNQWFTEKNAADWQYDMGKNTELAKLDL